MLKTILLRTTGVALALALLPAAFSAPARAAGGTLTVAQTQDPGSWDPIDTFLLTWASVATNIFDGLVYRGADMKLVPALATSWKVSDDGMKITFKLRKNVTFQDGEPFNAAAVKFTFDRLLGPEGKKGPQQANYTAIGEVKVIDDETVEFDLKQPDPVLITKFAGYGAMIVPPKYIKEKGEDYFNSHPIGTGPFQVVDYKPNVSVTLNAFKNYWGGAPKVDKVVYRFIAEPATEVAELQAGRVDVVMTPVPIAMIPTIKKDSDLKVETVTSPTVTALRFNTQSGATNSVEVRKALIMAIDRKAIIKAILSSQANPIASFQSKLSFGDDPDLKMYPYDPEQAKAMLKKAGIAPGTKMQIDYRGSDATFGEVAQAVASYLQMVGIRATLKPYESNVFLNDIVPKGKTGAMFQQTWGGWTFDYDNTAYLLYHSGQFWNPYDKDAKLDKMLEAQRSITDHAKREKALQEIADYVHEQAWEIELYNQKAVYGVNKRVKGFVPAADNRLRLLNVSVQ